MAGEHVVLQGFSCSGGESSEAMLSSALLVAGSGCAQGSNNAIEVASVAFALLGNAPEQATVPQQQSNSRLLDVLDELLVYHNNEDNGPRQGSPLEPLLAVGGSRGAADSANLAEAAPAGLTLVSDTPEQATALQQQSSRSLMDVFDDLVSGDGPRQSGPPESLAIASSGAAMAGAVALSLRAMARRRPSSEPSTPQDFSASQPDNVPISLPSGPKPSSLSKRPRSLNSLRRIAKGGNANIPFVAGSSGASSWASTSSTEMRVDFKDFGSAPAKMQSPPPLTSIYRIRECLADDDDVSVTEGMVLGEAEACEGLSDGATGGEAATQ